MMPAASTLSRLERDKLRGQFEEAEETVLVDHGDEPGAQFPVRGLDRDGQPDFAVLLRPSVGHIARVEQLPGILDRLVRCHCAVLVC
jgi:hypothetical protein